MRALVVVFITSSLIANTSFVTTAPSPSGPFDQYGAIRWNDEMARLDNFAIQLQNYEKSIGFIVTVDADGGCPGEAKPALYAQRDMLSSTVAFRGIGLAGESTGITATSKRRF